MSGYNGTQIKKTAHATVTPSIKDLHWAAGFIEGEGSFVSMATTARVSVDQVNKEPVLRLLALFGGSLKLYQSRHNQTLYKKQRNPCWLWCTTGSRARGIMMTLYPLMSAKRQKQIRHAAAGKSHPESERT